VVVGSEGLFKPCPPERAIAYRASFSFDESPQILVAFEICPNFGVEEVRAFLALCWALPSLSEWALNSPDGWICQDRGDGSGRDYQGFLSFREPVALFLTGRGAHLTVKGLRWKTPVPPQRVVVHGLGFFLCFYDGHPAPLVREGRYGVEFSLSLEEGVPAPGKLSEGR